MNQSGYLGKMELKNLLMLQTFELSIHTKGSNMYEAQCTWISDQMHSLFCNIMENIKIIYSHIYSLNIYILELLKHYVHMY